MNAEAEKKASEILLALNRVSIGCNFLWAEFNHKKFILLCFVGFVCKNM